MDADLKRLRSQIAKQEKELAALSESKSDIARQISIMQKKQADERRAISILSKQQNANNRKIRELQAKEKELAARQKLFEKQAALGIAFIVNNSGAYIARAVMSGSDSAKIAGVLEVVGKLNSKLSTSVDTYTKTALEAAIVRKVLIVANSEIEMGLAESKVLTENYTRTQEELTAKLTLVKHDENAQKEYLNMLRQEQERITKALRESAKKRVITDYGIFAKLKGELPIPMQGKIVEVFGEKPIAGTKITIMHKGIKIVPTGNGVVNCVADGTVIYVDNINGLENILVIQHDQDYYTVYANLDEFYVHNADKVTRGTELGRIMVDFEGNPSYLYFEIRRHEIAVDPAEWFRKR